MSWFSDVFDDIGDVLDGGIGSVIGDVVGGVTSLLGSESQNSTARSIAASNNATSIELANTAHQREVADLKAAGLNPILSATGGSGASVPTLTTAPVQNTMSGMSHSASALAGDVADLAVKMAQADNISADTANKRVNNALLASQVTGTDIANKIASHEEAYRVPRLQTELEIAGQESAKRTAEAQKAAYDVTRSRYGAQLDQLAIHSAAAAASRADIDNRYYLSSAGQMLRKLQLGGKAVDDATSPVRHIIPFTQ